MYFIFMNMSLSYFPIVLFARFQSYPLWVCPRVKKLKETLATMQQLDKNMSNLRWWLSAMEAELSRPITYSVCDHQEIQRRLAEQQVSRTLTGPHIAISHRSVI